MILWVSLLAACWFLLTPMMVYPFRGGWDETFYLAQATSFACDLDYDIANDLFHTNLSWWSDDAKQYNTIEFKVRTSRQGRIRSSFAMGCSLLWAPAFWLGKVLGLLPSPPAGITYSPRLPPLQLLLLAYWSAFLAGITVYSCYRLTYLLGFEKGAASAAAIVCFVLTPLAFWSLRAPGYSHMSSAFAITLFLLCCVEYYRERNFITAATVGLSGGLVYIVRPADGILLLIGFVIWVRWLVLERRGGAKLPRNSLGEALTGCLAFVLMALFQWTFWKLSFAKWITVPQGPGFMNWWHPQLRMLLWGSYNAFLPWAPVVLISFVGLLLWLRRQLFWAGLFLLSILAAVYVASVSGDVQGGWSFGSRRLTGLYPLLAVGLANILRLVRVERSRIAVAGVTAVSLVMGLFLVRLRETGIRDLLGSWSTVGWSFGAKGQEAIALMLRSDYLVGIRKETALALPLSLCLALLLLLWLSWQGALIGFGSLSRKRRTVKVLVVGIIGILIVFHLCMIATDGRDNKYCRASMVELQKAVRTKDLQEARTQVEKLRAYPRFEMAASVLAARVAWEQGQYRVGMLHLAPLKKKVSPKAFEGLDHMMQRFALRAMRSGQLRN